MKIGFIGLGNVGGKLAESLFRNQFDLTVYDLDNAVTDTFKSKGIKLDYVDLDPNGRLNLNKVFSKAYSFGISSIIVEGGKLLTESLLKNKLINEFYLFKSNKNLKKLGKNNIYNYKKKIKNLFKRKVNIETFLNGDKITRYF